MDNQFNQLCESYIGIIKNNKLYEPEKLTAILKTYNYEFGIDCMMSLSEYYDKIDNEYDQILDEKFNYRMATEYGYTKRYNQKMDIECDNLTIALKETGEII